jgi:UDP-N-acetylmuramate--alanine ligase
MEDMSNDTGMLEAVRKVHFVGVGGIGMSALARLFLAEGKQVSGSDRAVSAITEALEREGVHFYPTQIAANISADTDLVVYTEAMPKDHEELLGARTQGIRTISYFDALGMVANQYRLIAVAGSHGKTTTTAMLIDIFEAAGLDPNAVVGSLRATTCSNYRKGKGSHFIAEACEYRRDFLSLTPDVLVITNVEFEHVDYYKTLEDVQQAFCELALQVREGGAIIANLSDPALEPIIAVVKEKDVRLIDYAKYVDPLMPITMPGMHNRLNAGAALAVAEFYGVSLVDAKVALATFRGTWRRFEYKGEVNGAQVYDDYGHHPTEIVATINGMRELYPNKKLTLVFQPHTYTRTHTFFNEFVDALSRADRVFVVPIYAAREENTSGVTHTALADAVGKRQVPTEAIDSFDTVVTLLKSTVTPEDVVLVMGAGDVSHVASMLIP